MASVFVHAEAGCLAWRTASALQAGNGTCRLGDLIHEFIYKSWSIATPIASITSESILSFRNTTMPFKSQNHHLSLSTVCSTEGLILDVPPSGKLVVCSGDTLRCVLRLKDPTKIETVKLDFAGYQVSWICLTGISRYRSLRSCGSE